MLYLLSLILITAQAEEFDVISKPVELPSSEEVVLEFLIPTDVIVQLPTEESPVIGDGEAEINEDSSVEPVVSPPPEPDVEQTAAPIMFMVTCHATRTSITYTFTPVEGDPP